MFKFKANQLLLMNQFLLINLLNFHPVITQETTPETIATIGFTETSNDLTSSTTVLSDDSTEIIDLTTESNGTLLTTIKSIDVTTKATTEATTETTTEVPTTTISDPVKVIDYTTELFNKDCLNVHNQFRTLHGVEPLKMDDNIIEFARQRAATLARLNDTSYLKHESGNYGENLAAWPLFGSINCSEVSQIWFDEYKYVSNWSNPDSFTPYTYHFTQIVWSTTRSIGCGMAGLEGSDWIFICCNYDPPGNYLEEFQYNVKPPSYLNESVNEVQHPPQIGKNCKCTCQV